MDQLIYHGECQNIFPSAEGFDCMITDPPYSDWVHAKAVSQSKVRGARKRELGFEPLSNSLRQWLAHYAATTKRWSVLYSDIESTHLMREACGERGVIYIRTLAWIRWSMPQLSGDRPPQGREDLLIFHAEVEDNMDLALFYGVQKGKKAWNGPGNLTHLMHKCLRGEGKHKAEKPLDQVLDLVSWFSDPGETIFDPLAGAGTIGVACKILGRGYVGVEKDEQWAQYAAQRIAAVPNLSDRDQERFRRWDESRKAQ